MIHYDPKRTVPYWAPGAWQYLETLLTPDDYCFEWGGGQSTKWMADRVGFILTVENRPEWAERILRMTKGCTNCQVILASRLSDRYVDAVDLLHGLINVYLIDGYQRINCLKKVTELRQPGDIIVMDDALDYADSTEFGTIVRRFRMPHPSAGLPIPKSNHGNTNREVHAQFKETWIVKMP